MRRFLLLLAIFALSCGNTARPDFMIHLVTGNGGRPFDECGSGTIRVDVAQSTNAVLTRNGTVTGGSVGDLSVEIPSYGLVTQIQVTMSCPSLPHPLQIGSTPEFIPVGYGLVDIIMGEPEQCVQISTPTLVPPRIGPRLVSLGANVLVVGGLDDASTPIARIQGLDPVTFTTASMPGDVGSLTPALGLGAALPITGSSNRATFLFVTLGGHGIFDATIDLAANARVTTPFDVPLSAGPDSAVVDLGTYGIAIVGGSNGSDGATDITWVSADGLTASSGMLTHARRRPSATLVGGKLLVAGGQAAGEPLFELVAIRGTDPGIAFGPTDELRYAPVLTTDGNRTVAFVALGSLDPEDESMVQSTTHVLHDCRMSGPTAGCVVADGPAWPEAPRGHVRMIEHHVGTGMGADDYETLVIGGTDPTGNVSTLIDRIHFDGGTSGPTFSITPVGGPGLVGARSLAGAANVGGGVVLVAGGADAGGHPLGTLELCFPIALAPITSI